VIFFLSDKLVNNLSISLEKMCIVGIGLMIAIVYLQKFFFSFFIPSSFVIRIPFLIDSLPVSYGWDNPPAMRL